MSERLTVLGSGVGAYGLPFQREIRYPPGYLLEKNDTQILIECSEGIDTRLTQLRIDYGSISTVFVSHFHPDHFQLPNFVHSASLKRTFEENLPLKLKLIGPEGLEENFWTIWNVIWSSTPNSIFWDNRTNIEFIELKDGGSVNFSEKAQLATYSTFHEGGKVPALAMKVEFKDGFVFAYSGDSGVCEGLHKAADSADVFLCEISANIGEDKSKTAGHLNPHQAAQVAARAKVKKLWLTHYWGKDTEQEITNEIQRGGYQGKVHLVKDFEKLTLK